MTRSLWLIAALCSCSAVRGQGPYNCNVYNQTFTPATYINSDDHKHSSGNHAWTDNDVGTCTYVGQAQIGPTTPCIPTATTRSTSSGADSGGTGLYFHEVTYKDAQGTTQGAAGQTATADAEGAFAVESCVVPLGCTGVGITINGAGNGGGFTIGYSTTALWGDQHHYSLNCTGYTLPSEVSACPNPTSPPPYNPEGGETWEWNVYTYTWQLEQNNSPIVVDTTGKGWQFSDPRKGDYVSFDLQGNRKYLKLSWPVVGSGNAWLVYDRDGDGIIKDGTELFGNYSPHAAVDVPGAEPNGFNALGWWDQPVQGGNGDQILDKRDAIWPKLRLWIDEHCYQQPDQPCYSLPAELHTLESKGVTSISLVYGGKIFWDATGNEFKFYSLLNPDAETNPTDENGAHGTNTQKSRDGRLVYDVWLKSVK